MRKRFIMALMALGLLAPLVFGSCSSVKETASTTQSSGEGFAVYLTRDDIPVSQMASLSHLEIAGEPVFSLNDIVSYDSDTHIVKLTAAAYKRVRQLKVPTSGKSFLVCLDKMPVYWGAFWTPASSQSFDGVIIMVPPSSLPENIIQITLGNPSPDYFQGVDDRSNLDLMMSLNKAGKLVPPLVLYSYRSPQVTPVPEGFAIYLTRDDVSVARMPLITQIEIADTPLISIKDIISYTKSTHAIELTAAAFQRVGALQVPTTGKAFVVCLDKVPVYWGAFWTPISSQAFSGVTIMVPPFPSGELPANTIQIGPGYPSASFYQGEDPRSNSEIMQSMEAAGELK